MILVDWHSWTGSGGGRLFVDPFEPALVQPNSLDIRLGDHFVWYLPGEGVIDPYDRDSVCADVDECRAKEFVLYPGQFVLAETSRADHPPRQHRGLDRGQVLDRPALGRAPPDRGLDRRRLLGLDHARDVQRQLAAGEGLRGHADWQLVFYTTERAERPYSSKGDAKYQGQRQATLSKYHENPRVGAG